MLRSTFDGPIKYNDTNNQEPPTIPVPLQQTELNAEQQIETHVLNEHYIIPVQKELNTELQIKSNVDNKVPPPPVPLQQTELNTVQQIEIPNNQEQPTLITPTTLERFQRTEFSNAQQTEILGETEKNDNCFVKKCLIL